VLVLRDFLLGKIHCATVARAQIDYVGSIAIDAAPVEAARVTGPGLQRWRPPRHLLDDCAILSRGSAAGWCPFGAARRGAQATIVMIARAARQLARGAVARGGAAGVCSSCATCTTRLLPSTWTTRGRCFAASSAVSHP